MTTVSTQAVHVPESQDAVFQQVFLRRAQQFLPYFVGTMAAQHNLRSGSTDVRWRRFEHETPLTDGHADTATTDDLAELTGSITSMFMGRTSDTPSITAVTATVRKYGQFYALTEEIDLFNVSGTTLELVAVLGESAGRSLNHLQRTIAEGSGVTAIFPASIASEGAVVTKLVLATVASAINALVRNGARAFTPMTTGSVNIGTSAILPSFWAICHPDVAYDVSQMSGFVGVQNYAGQTMTAVGEFGLIQTAGFGVRFLQTQEAGINLDGGGTNAGGIRGTSDTDTYDVPVFGQDAFGSVGLGTRHTDGVYRTGENEGNFELIMHPKGSGGVADPFNEVSTIAWKAWWAGAVLNAAFSRKMVCGATSL